MNTKAVSATKPVFHPFATKNTTQQNITTISFTCNVAKSRVLFANQSKYCRTRLKAQIQAVYAPAKTTETLYDLLGITEAVDPSDIKKAYKQMARKYHPDVSPPDRVDEYTNKFIMVHEAYETLSNPQMRASYDKDLAGGFTFGSKTSRGKYNNGMGETEDWRTKWESQLDGLKRENVNKGNNVSWGARMRNERQYNCSFL